MLPEMLVVTFTPVILVKDGNDIDEINTLFAIFRFPTFCRVGRERDEREGLFATENSSPVIVSRGKLIAERDWSLVIVKKVPT